MFINYFTIPFCIFARYYWICILGSVRYVMAFYNYFVVNFQTTQLLKLIVKPKYKIVTINSGHHSET